MTFFEALYKATEIERSEFEGIPFICEGVKGDLVA